MAVNKVVFGTTVLVDLMSDTVASDKMLSGYTAHDKSGAIVTGNITTNTAGALSASGPTVSVPAGYYASTVSKTVSTTAHPSPTVSINTSTGVITASHTQTAGYVGAGTTSSTLGLTTIAATTITPNESIQTAVEVGKYTTGTIKVDRISSTYVGSGIPRRDSSDLTSGGDTVYVTAGYYEAQASKAIATGTLGTPTITVATDGMITARGSVSSSGYLSTSKFATATTRLTTKSAATITPTTTTQTAVNANVYTTGVIEVAPIPSEYIIPTGTTNISSNGTVDVTQYTSASVNVPGFDLPTFTAIFDNNYNITGVSCDKSFSECFNGIDHGLVSAGFRTDELGNIQTDLVVFLYSESRIIYMAYLDNLPGWYIVYHNDGQIDFHEDATDFIEDLNITQNGEYGPSQLGNVIGTVTVSVQPNNQNKTVSPATTTQTYTADSGYTGLGTVTVNAMPTGVLSTPAISISNTGLITATAGISTTGYITTASTKSNTSQLTTKAATTITPTTSTQTAVNANVYTTGVITVAPMPTGTLGTPTITVSTTGLITAKATVQTAGYLATTVSSTKTSQLTVKAAQTYTPSTQAQTIASGQYLTGAQTISGDADLVASNIISTANIFGVQGSVVIQHYYTGSTAPTSGLGANGDIYLQTS